VGEARRLWGKAAWYLDDQWIGAAVPLWVRCAHLSSPQLRGRTHKYGAAIAICVLSHGCGRVGLPVLSRLEGEATTHPRLLLVPGTWYRGPH